MLDTPGFRVLEFSGVEGSGFRVYGLNPKPCSPNPQFTTSSANLPLRGAGDRSAAPSTKPVAG